MQLDAHLLFEAEPHGFNPFLDPGCRGMQRRRQILDGGAVLILPVDQETQCPWQLLHFHCITSCLYLSAFRSKAVGYIA